MFTEPESDNCFCLIAQVLLKSAVNFINYGGLPIFCYNCGDFYIKIGKEF